MPWLSALLDPVAAPTFHPLWCRESPRSIGGRVTPAVDRGKGATASDAGTGSSAVAVAPSPTAHGRRSLWSAGVIRFCRLPPALVRND